MRIQSKQIEQLLQGFLQISGLSAVISTATTVITTPLTTLLGSAGRNGVAVPLQVATTTTEGVITSGSGNRAEIFDAVTKDKILNLACDSEEVYGRITEAAGVYSIDYYYLANGTGVETAFTFPATQSIDIELVYQFSFEHLPADFATSIKTRNVADDGKSKGFGYQEGLTVTATNTVSNLSFSPVDPAQVKLTINGQSFYSVLHFTVTGLAISFSGPQLAAMGLGQIDTTDTVYAEYRRF